MAVQGVHLDAVIVRPARLGGQQENALALEFDALRGRQRAEIVAARDRYERGLREILAEGVRRQVFRPLDPKIVTFAILGAINWIARWYRAGGGNSAEEIGELFADLFVSGLKAPGGGGGVG